MLTLTSVNLPWIETGFWDKVETVTGRNVRRKMAGRPKQKNRRSDLAL